MSVDSTAKAFGRLEFAQELEEMLWPERFPPGHERHDPDHMYWVDGQHEYDAAFQWRSDTIEWVGQKVQIELDHHDQGRST